MPKKLKMKMKNEMKGTFYQDALRSLIDHLHNDVTSFEILQHCMPRFNVDSDLSSVHCSQQRIKLFCTWSCNIMI